MLGQCEFIFLRGKPRVTGLRRRCLRTWAHSGLQLLWTEADAAQAARRAAWASAFGFCLNCSFWNKVPITPTSPSYHQAPVNPHVGKSPDLRFSSLLLINKVHRHMLKSFGSCRIHIRAKIKPKRSSAEQELSSWACLKAPGSGLLW